jgi:MFS family permease
MTVLLYRRQRRLTGETSMVRPSGNPPATRRAGIGQGIVLVTAAFLPALAIISLVSAVPTIIDHFHASPRVGLRVPLLVSAPGLTVALLGLFAGMLVDKFGRRRLPIGATALYGLAGMAPLCLDGLNAIFISRLAVGVAEAAVLTITNTLIADYWDPAARRRWLVVQGVAGPLVSSGVIWLSGILTAAHWNGVFVIYGVALPIAAAMAALIFEPHRQIDPAPQAAIRTTKAVLLVEIGVGAVTVFVATLYFVFIIQGGLALREVGVTDPARIGRIISMCSLAVPLGALLFGAIGRARPVTHVAVLLVLLSAGLTCIGLAPNWHWMVAALLVQQTGAGMTVPALIAWALSRLPPEHRGRGMGIWTSCFFIGQFTSPFFVALFKQVSDTVQGAFVVAGTIGLVGAAVAVAIALQDSRKRTSALPAPSPHGSEPTMPAHRGAR